MRVLLALIVTVAALWSGYWMVGSSGVKAAYADWFEERRARGWLAEYSDLTVRGFPNRFDTTFSELALADPETGLAWRASMFQILALSYKPNHLIAAWPERQRIATPLAKYDVTSDGLRASLVVEPGPDLTLRRAVLTAGELAFAPVDRAGRTAIDTLSLAAERVPGDAAPSYRLGLKAGDLAPPLPWRSLVDPRGTLPERLDAVSADLTVRFDKPWDRGAIEEARPQPRRIRIRLAEARWGRLQLQAAGALEVNAAGTPEGEITLKARNWREILQIAEQSGALNPGFADTLEDGLSLISRMAGHPKTLDIPLTFRSGRIKLGPVPLGAAPVLRLR